MTDVVGEEQDRLARFAQGGDGVDRARERVVADPDGSRRGRAGRGRRDGRRGRAARGGRIILARRATTPRRPHRLPRAARRRLRLRQGVRRAERHDAARRRRRRAPPLRPPGSCPTAASKASQAGAQGRRQASRSRPRSSTKSKTYVATVSTTCGDFEITLDAKRAPITGGTFKYLADKKFFDGTDLPPDRPGLRDPGRRPGRHRRGRPGLHGRRGAAEGPQVRRRASSRWPRRRPSPPGTSGSQFFVVTGAGAATLTPDYALLGKVTTGMDVVDEDRRHPGRPEHGPARRSPS